MSKGLKLASGVFVAFLGLSFLHAWLNIGLQKFNFFSGRQANASVRVGFLPVT